MLTAILLAPAAVLLAAGALLLALYLLGNVMQVDVRFESSDGRWADTERTFKGYGYDVVKQSFQTYKEASGQSVSMVRTTPIDWRRIQLWPTYLMNPKWRVPYAARRVAADQLLPAAQPTGPKARLITSAATGELIDLPDSSATATAVEYLDQCLKQQSSGTLVGMLGYVDARQKLVPAVEEVNAALAQRPAMHVRRASRSVTFNQDGPDRTVTDEDLKHAYQAYRQALRGLPRKRGP